MKIAICGKMGSGKSYIAKKIAEKYNYKVYSFASYVKELAIKLFNMNGKDRHLLQTLAEKMKEIDEDVWVNVLLRDIANKDNIIIDDLRFPNELNALKNLNFVILNVWIDEEIRLKRLKDKYINFNDHIKYQNHISENGIDDLKIDFKIKSDENCLTVVQTMLGLS